MLRCCDFLRLQRLSLLPYAVEVDLNGSTHTIYSPTSRLISLLLFLAKTSQPITYTIIIETTACMRMAIAITEFSLHFSLRLISLRFLLLFRILLYSIDS